MRFRSFLAVLLLFSLLISAPGSSTASAPQYPRWLYGATGYERAIQLQRESNLSLVIYFYTDRCSDCRSLETQYLSSPAVHRALQRSIAVTQTLVGELMIKNGEAADAIKLLRAPPIALEKSFAASPTDESAARYRSRCVSLPGPR